MGNEEQGKVDKTDMYFDGKKWVPNEKSGKVKLTQKKIYNKNRAKMENL